MKDRKYRHGGEGEKAYPVKMDFSVNLNPLGPPETVRQAALGLEREITDYPKRVDQQKLKEGISRYWRNYYGTETTRDQIILGNGASELIHGFIRMINPGKALLQAPCFYGYERALLGTGCRITYSPVKDMADEIQRHQPELVCLCNPANPTGELFAVSQLLDIAAACERTKAHLFVDECFLELTGDCGNSSMTRFLNENSYLTVINAFTKYYSMAGVRLGYAFASKALLGLRPEEHLCEWNVSSIALVLGMAALEAGEDYRKQTLLLLKKEREYLTGRLEKLGLEYIYPAANYIFFRCGRELYRPLLERGILIRACNNYQGIPAEGHYRIAIKKRAENEVLAAAIKEIIEETLMPILIGNTVK